MPHLRDATHDSQETYSDEHLTFQPPHGWRDETIVSFVSPLTTGGPRPNIVMTREAKNGATLDQHVDRQTRVLANGLAGFTLRAAIPREVDGRRAIEVQYSWTNDGRPVEQSVVHVAPNSEEDRVTTFTYTAPWPGSFEGPVLFDAVLASVRFRAPAGAATSPKSGIMPRGVVDIPMPGDRRGRG